MNERERELATCALADFKTQLDAAWSAYGTIMLAEPWEAWDEVAANEAAAQITVLDGIIRDLELRLNPDAKLSPCPTHGLTELGDAHLVGVASPEKPTPERGG